MVLVDSVAWSLAFRRDHDNLAPPERAVAAEVKQLAIDDAAVLIGPVRTEFLCGIRSRARFDRLRDAIDGFRLLPLESSTWDLAASAYNRCRSAGIQPGTIDMLICAAAMEQQSRILTLDSDFPRYAEILPIRLHMPTKG